MAKTKRQNAGIRKAARENYYTEIPYLTPRVKLAMVEANKEFSKGDKIGIWQIVGSQCFLRPDGRLSFRAKRHDKKGRKTEWVSLHSLRVQRNKNAHRSPSR